VRRKEIRGLLLQLSNLHVVWQKRLFSFFFPVIIESVSVVSRQLGELFDVARIRKEAPFPSCGSIGKTSSRRPLFRTVGAAPLNSSFLTGHDSHVMEFISE
jgi:hypothetical protein